MNATLIYNTIRKFTNISYSSYRSNKELQTWGKCDLLYDCGSITSLLSQEKSIKSPQTPDSSILKQQERTSPESGNEPKPSIILKCLVSQQRKLPFFLQITVYCSNHRLFVITKPHSLLLHLLAAKDSRSWVFLAKVIGQTIFPYFQGKSHQKAHFTHTTFLLAGGMPIALINFGCSRSLLRHAGFLWLQ